MTIFQDFLENRVPICTAIVQTSCHPCGVDPQVARQPERFYDGGTDSEPPRPYRVPVIELERTLTEPAQRFRMMRRIGYRDREYGELLVPADLSGFETDLTSVPAVFAWLVPKTGTHLPAALLHDGLVYSPGQAPSYVSTDGHDLDRIEANRVFRAAMADTGTGLVRRWLMWAAVTVATMISGVGTRWSTAERWRWRLTALVTIVVVCVLGALATLDLFDLPGPGVPWMGGSFGAELVGGAAGAIVIPFVLGLLWGRFWIVGVILAISLALLLHVTVAIVVLTALYQGLERLVSHSAALALSLGMLLLAAATVVFVVALA